MWAALVRLRRGRGGSEVSYGQTHEANKRAPQQLGQPEKSRLCNVFSLLNVCFFPFFFQERKREKKRLHSSLSVCSLSPSLSTLVVTLPAPKVFD